MKIFNILKKLSDPFGILVQFTAKGRLVRGYLSIMGIAHSKLIPTVWLKKTKYQTHILNPQRMGF